MVIVALVASIMTITYSSADNLNVEVFTVTFPRPTIVVRGNFSYIYMDRSSYPEATGEPMLPIRMYLVALPPTYSELNVEIKSIISENIRLNKSLAPKPKPQLIFYINYSTPPVPSYNFTVYPSSILVGTYESTFRGLRILVLLISPLQYYPQNNTLRFHKVVVVRVSYRSEEIETSISRDRLVERLVKEGLFLNGEKVFYRISKVKLPVGKIIGRGLDDLEQPTITPVEVIITSSALKSAADRLAEWKTISGIPTYVACVEDIYNVYTGIDEAQKIRNFIKDAYNTWGITTVLLFGDADIVPTRYIYNDDCDEGGWFSNGTHKPTDWYYAGITIDQDLGSEDGWYAYSSVLGKWGWGYNSTIADDGKMHIQWIPDLIVARIPVDTLSEANQVVNKIINYETNPEQSSWASRMLLAGAVITTDPIYSDAEYKEALRTNVLLNNMSEYVKLYDPDGVNTNLTKENFLYWSNISSLVQFAAHGGTYLASDQVYQDGYWQWYDFIAAWDALSMNNLNRLPLIFAYSCLTCAFDAEEFGGYHYNGYSLAEAYVCNPNGGAIAYVGWARVTWGALGWLDVGYGESMDTWFWKYFFTTGGYRPGLSLYLTKAHYGLVYQSDYNARIKVFTALHLLGDPDVDIWTGEPQTMSCSIPSRVSVGEEVTIETEPYARVTVSNISYGFYVTGVADSEGEFSFNAPTQEMTLTVVCKKHNYIPFQGTIQVTGVIINVPEYISVVRGYSGVATVNVIAGADHHVMLVANSSSEIRVALEPVNGTGSFTSTLYVYVSPNVEVRNYTLTIYGIVGSQVMGVNSTTINVQDLEVSAETYEVRLPTGSEDNVNYEVSLEVYVKGFNGFSDTVDLSCSISPNTDDVSISVDPSTCTPNGTAILSITVGEEAEAGEYEITIEATSSGGISRTTTITLYVREYSKEIDRLSPTATMFKRLTEASRGAGIDIWSSNIYAAGSILQGDWNILVAGYDLIGDEIFSTTWNSGDNDYASGLSVANGYIYVSGYKGAEGSRDVVLIKLDGSGSITWVEELDLGRDDYSSDVHASSSHVCVVGTSVGFYGKEYGERGLIALYEVDGTKLWSITWGSTNNTAHGVYINGSYIYVVGRMTTTNEAFVLKLDFNGIEVWSTTWPGTVSDIVVVGNYLYVCGGGGSITLTKLDGDGNVIWTKTLDIDGEVYAITYSNGYLYVAGKIPGNGYDVIVLKFSLDGELLWMKTYGLDGDDVAIAIAANGGAIYTAGYTDSLVDEGSLLILRINEFMYSEWNLEGDDYGVDVVYSGGYIYVLSNEYPEDNANVDSYLLKYSLSGNLEWQAYAACNYASTHNDTGKAITCDAYGNIYVAGFLDTSDSVKGLDFFVSKIDSGGSCTWITLSGLDGDDVLCDIEAGADGLYAVGRYSGDILLVKLDYSGSILWTKTWGDASRIELGYRLTLDSDGNIYVLANYTGSYGIVITKFTSDGSQIWSTEISTNNPAYLSEIKVRGETVFIAVTVYDEISLSYDVHVFKLNATNGEILWSRTWRGDGTDMALDITLDNDAYLYVVGATDSFNEGTPIILILKYSFDGVLTRSLLWQIGGSISVAHGCDLVGTGRIAITGMKYPGGTGTADTFVAVVDVPNTLEDIFEIFTADGEVNATIIVGSSEPHGPSGGANAIDTVGGMNVAIKLGYYGLSSGARLYLDTDVSWYDEDEFKVYYYDVPGLTNIITIAGPGVNQISWKYFCNPWYAPVYTYYSSDYGDWILVTPGSVYVAGDWVSVASPLRDLVVIELIYVNDEGRYVLWISGFGGYGTRAGCFLVQLMNTGLLPINMEGQAVIVEWIDSDGDAKPSLNDTWRLVEVVNT